MVPAITRHSLPTLWCILVLKLNSQPHSCECSGLAAPCRHPLMRHHGNQNISLLELNKLWNFLFLFFSFLSFILSVLNKFQFSAMQVVQFCTPLCALIKLASGSYCWLPAECSQIQSLVGVLGGPFYSLVGSCSGRLLVFRDIWALRTY